MRRGASDLDYMASPRKIHPQAPVLESYLLHDVRAPNTSPRSAGTWRGVCCVREGTCRATRPKCGVARGTEAGAMRSAVGSIASGCRVAREALDRSWRIPG